MSAPISYPRSPLAPLDISAESLPMEDDPSDAHRRSPPPSQSPVGMGSGSSSMSSIRSMSLENSWTQEQPPSYFEGEPPDYETGAAYRIRTLSSALILASASLARNLPNHSIDSPSSALNAVSSSTPAPLAEITAREFFETYHTKNTEIQERAKELKAALHSFTYQTIGKKSPQEITSIKERASKLRVQIDALNKKIENLISFLNKHSNEKRKKWLKDEQIKKTLPNLYRDLDEQLKLEEEVIANMGRKLDHDGEFGDLSPLHMPSPSMSDEEDEDISVSSDLPEPWKSFVHEASLAYDRAIEINAHPNEARKLQEIYTEFEKSFLALTLQQKEKNPKLSIEIEVHLKSLQAQIKTVQDSFLIVHCKTVESEVDAMVERSTKIEIFSATIPYSELCHLNQTLCTKIEQVQATITNSFSTHIILQDTVRNITTKLQELERLANGLLITKEKILEHFRISKNQPTTTTFNSLMIAFQREKHLSPISSLKTKTFEELANMGEVLKNLQAYVRKTIQAKMANAILGIKDEPTEQQQHLLKQLTEKGKKILEQLKKLNSELEKQLQEKKPSRISKQEILHYYFGSRDLPISRLFEDLELMRLEETANELNPSAHFQSKTYEQLLQTDGRIDNPLKYLRAALEPAMTQELGLSPEQVISGATHLRRLEKFNQELHKELQRKKPREKEHKEPARPSSASKPSHKPAGMLRSLSIVPQAKPRISVSEAAKDFFAHSPFGKKR